MIVSVFVAGFASAAAQDASRPLRVYGNMKTIDLAPVLFAATQRPTRGKMFDTALKPYFS